MYFFTAYHLIPQILCGKKVFYSQSWKGFTIKCRTGREQSTVTKRLKPGDNFVKYENLELKEIISHAVNLKYLPKN